MTSSFKWIRFSDVSIGTVFNYYDSKFNLLHPHVLKIEQTLSPIDDRTTINAVDVFNKELEYVFNNYDYIEPIKCKWISI